MTAEAKGQLLRNLVLFGRVLRGLGLDVNPGRVIDLVKALSLVRVEVRSEFYHASRSLLVHRREDIPLFDEAFEMFWHKPIHEWEIQSLAGRPFRRPAPRPLPVPAGQSGEPDDGPGSDDDDTREVLELTRTFSAEDALRSKDFSELSESEIDEVRGLIAELTWRLGERLTRRYRRGHGARIDLRRTLRQSLRHGGEVLRFALREPRRKPRPLVVLADISGSMERYTRLLLHFVYGLTQGLGQRVDTFAFGTRLTGLSRHLRERDIGRALTGVSESVSDWSGGTRIGECLATFNYDWARRVLGGGAVVLLISDGWDRGEPEDVAREMSRLQRSCHRLIWLNPLLGSPDYEPLTRGMAAALPYVDDFLPVHNLESLEALARHLEGLGGR